MKTLHLLLSFLLVSSLSLAKTKIVTEEYIKTDLEKVWPLVQTVKIEFDLATAQMEFLNTAEEKKAFMEEYESFIKNKYFKKVINLNLRQGKLLLLLIDRELGKTPFELLKEYRSVKQANSWQQFAKFVGADLKEEYDPALYPFIEREVQLTYNQIGKAK